LYYYQLRCDEYIFDRICVQIKPKGGEKMRKQGLILVIATLMAVILCGAASAADSSTIGGEGDISDVNSSEEADPILWVNVTYEYNDTIISRDYSH